MTIIHVAQKTEEIEILHNKEKGYYYMWNNTGNYQVRDECGVDITFDSEEECIEYLEETNEAVITPV